MDKLLERFFQYSVINTCVDGLNGRSDSISYGQQEYAKQIQKDLIQQGGEGVTITKEGYVKGFLPANIDTDVPAITFISHLDTPFYLPGVSRFYLLKHSKQEYLRRKLIYSNYYRHANEFNCHNDVLILGDGESVLGVANKASIAQFLTLAERIKQQGYLHGNIYFLFITNHTCFAPINDEHLVAQNSGYIFTLDAGGYYQWSAKNVKMEQITVTVSDVLSFNQSLSSTSKIKNIVDKIKYYHQVIIDNVIKAFSPLIKHLPLNTFEQTEQKITLNYFISDEEPDNLVGRKQKLFQYIEMLRMQLSVEYMIDISSQHLLTNNYSPKAEQVAIIKQTMLEHQHLPIQCINKNIFSLSGRLNALGFNCISLWNGGYNHFSGQELLFITQMNDCVKMLLRIVQLVVERNKTP